MHQHIILRTGTAIEATPIPVPMKNLPVKRSGLNKLPAISGVISIINHPTDNGRLHITMVNCRPL